MKSLDLIMRHFMYALGMVLIPFFCNAQSSSYPVNVSYNNMGVPAPETWIFMKYGAQKPNLYTGTVNANIPIYNYKDKDFEIPLELMYASNGYIPNTQAGSAGLGWILNTGGCITREVNGVKDEEGEGYLQYATGNPPQQGNYFLSNVYWDVNQNIKYPYFKTASGRYWSETTPDIFTFNFCGHSGAFILSPTGVRVYNTTQPSGEYKVDLSQLRNKTIKITTGDGYEYLFIMDEGNTINTNMSGGGSVELGNKWNLKKITAPNGRTVEFEYIIELYENRRPAGLTATFYQDDRGLFWTVQNGQFKEIRTPSKTNFFPYRLKTRGTVSLVKCVIIDDKVRIECEYSPREHSERWRAPYSGLDGIDPADMKSTQKLDAISIWEMDGSKYKTLLKECKLNYKYGPIPGNPVMMLKEVSLSGVGSYLMEYYNSDTSFPYHTSTAIDHWGYYNGKEGYEPQLAIPDPYFNRDQYPCFQSTSRDPNSNYAIKGMLQKITYPTKGYSLFSYQSHDFSQAMDHYYLRENFSSSAYKIDANTWRAGGMRIWKIEDYNQDNTLAKQVEYRYKLSSKSSGILTILPKYMYQYYILTSTSIDVEKVIGVIELMEPNVDELISSSTKGNHIEYCEVEEVNSDGSYTLYSYTSQTDYPDEEVSGATLWDVDLQAALPISMEGQRGKPFTTVVVNAQGDVVKRIDNEYDTSKELDRVFEAKLAPVGVYEHAIITENYPLKSVTTTTRLKNGVLKSQVDYEYNKRNQIATTTTIDSNSDTIRVRKNYAYEMPSGSIADLVLRKNLLSLPWKSLKTVQGNGNQENIVDATLYSYKQSSGYVLPASVATAGNLPVPVTTEPNYIRDISYDRYDSHGNLVQSTDKSGLTTSYIWGYGGLYLVAKIDNCTFDRVMHISGLSTLESTPLTGNLPETARNKLYDINTMTENNYQITVYERIPFVGISRITDTSGRSIYYEYNDDWKLCAIRDHDGNLLQEYKYNVISQ